MSAVLVELTEEERVGVLDVIVGAQLGGRTLSPAVREAVRKMRDAEPSDKERVR